LVGNLLWKADFSEIIFKEKFIYLQNVIWIQYSGTPLATTTTHWTALNWPCSGLEWSRHTCIPKGFMYYRDHFISTILSLTESYLALSYVLP